MVVKQKGGGDELGVAMEEEAHAEARAPDS